VNIAKKILLGYGLLLIPFFIYLVYALSSLDQMDRINAAITRVNQPLYELTGGLAENLLWQEFYSQRLLILKNYESFELLQMRFGDFDNLMKEIASIKSPFSSVQEFYTKCTAFRVLLSESYGSLDAALAVSEQKRDLIGEKREELIELIKHLGTEIRRDQNSKIELSEAIGTPFIL